MKVFFGNALDDDCTLDTEAWTERRRLYTAYRAAAEDTGAKLLSAREFYSRIEQVAGVWALKRNGQRGFAGIDLNSGHLGQVGQVDLLPNASHGKKGAESALSAPTAPTSALNPAPSPSPADDAANDAYVNGLCRDCRAVPYSPGRPRCDSCHRTHQNLTAGYDR